jgi:hypothetical protein
MSIVPSKTPIHLVSDGLFDESSEEASATLTGYRLGQGPLEVRESHRCFALLLARFYLLLTSNVSQLSSLYALK